MVRSKNKGKRSKQYGIKKKRHLLKTQANTNNWSLSSLNKDLLKIGQKSDFFNDSSKSTSYAWTRLMPALDFDSPKSIFPNNGVLSLKLICSQRIAMNSDSLEPSFLDTAPWEIWLQVWKNILYLHKDSIRVFNLFANKFSHIKQFRCHLSPLSTGVMKSPEWEELVKIRNDALSSVMIPKSRNHRIENLFANINVLDVVKYIHRLSYNPWVLLDVSLMAKKYNREDYLKLFNINNLVALDLSNSQVVDDLFLYNMSTSIRKDGKLSKLTILKINNCPNATSKGLEYLVSISNDPDCNCSLAYVESDIKLYSSDFATNFQYVKEEDTKYIKNTRWSILEENPESRVIQNCPLALKLHCLYKDYSSRIIKKRSNMTLALTTNSVSYLYQSRNKIIMDLMIHEDNFISSENDFDKILKAWNTRIQKRNLKTSEIHSYIINYNHEFTIQPQFTESPNIPKDDSVIYRASTKNTVISHNRKRKKPVLRNFDVNQFFDM